MVMVASDGLMDEGKGHPRAAGTFARVLGRYVREQHALTLMDAVKKMLEEQKIVVRNIRRDALEELKKQEKNKEISQDDERKAEVDIQKLTDKFIAEIDQQLAAKEKEIMQV